MSHQFRSWKAKFRLSSKRFELIYRFLTVFFSYWQHNNHTNLSKNWYNSYLRIKYTKNFCARSTHKIFSAYAIIKTASFLPTNINTIKHMFFAVWFFLVARVLFFFSCYLFFLFSSYTGIISFLSFLFKQWKVCFRDQMKIYRFFHLNFKNINSVNAQRSLPFQLLWFIAHDSSLVQLFLINIVVKGKYNYYLRLQQMLCLIATVLIAIKN